MTGKLRSALPALLLVAACQTWSRVPGKPADAIAATNPGRVRISTSDGRVVVLTAARVVGDSVIGFDNHDVRVTVLLSRVYRVEQAHGVIDVGTYDRPVTIHDPPIGH